MIKYYKNKEQINTLEKGCWINVIEPTKEEILKLSKDVSIQVNVFNNALDHEEQSRTKINDNYKLIIVDIPSSEKHASYSVSVTIPLVIIHVRDDYIITMCIENTSIFDDFLSDKVKNFETNLKSRFTLMIFQKIDEKYISDLNNINADINKAEKNLKKATQNKELLKLMHLQKSLVYFNVSLKSNEALIEKIQKNNLIPLFLDDNNILEDVLIENRQAIEMCLIYSGILNNMIEAFGTIISNNLNEIMKFLAGFTIVISIPTMVASFMGMNVKFGNYVKNEITFFGILLFSLVLSIIVAIILKKKNML